MGSKAKIAKSLLPYIFDGKPKDSLYIEPFVGGANMIDKATGLRWGNDSNFELIEMWKALQNGWIPPESVSKQEYVAIQSNPGHYAPELRGFVGFLCSFGCKLWGGYAQNKSGRNYAAQGKKVLLKQIKNLKDVKFTNYSYEDMPIPAGSTIYCDPPYRGTTQYAGSKSFCHETFWEWARLQSKTSRVFVSEYTAPDDFICVKSINITSTLNKNKKLIKVENLYLHQSLL